MRLDESDEINLEELTVNIVSDLIKGKIELQEAELIGCDNCNGINTIEKRIQVLIHLQEPVLILTEPSGVLPTPRTLQTPALLWMRWISKCSHTKSTPIQ